MYSALYPPPSGFLVVPTSFQIHIHVDMSSPRILVYLLRRDLRLNDNPILHDISKTWQQSHRPYTHLLPVYVFAAQQLEISGFLSTEGERSPFPEARSHVGGFWRCGPHRAKFIAESVWDLRKSLQDLGSGLIIRVGMAGQVVQEILDALRQEKSEIVGVWMTDEEGVEEKREQRDVRNAAEKASAEFKLWTDEKYLVDEYEFRNSIEASDANQQAVETYLSKILTSFPTFSQPTASRSSPSEVRPVDLYLHRPRCPLFRLQFPHSKVLLASQIH